MKRTAVALIALLLPLTTAAQESEKPSPMKKIRQSHKIALGRTLFRSPLLSGREKMTCATCHEPGLSFTDGNAESPGILGSGVGRNSPTMFAIGHVPSFPGPRVTDRNPLKHSRALTLAERCLAPIENPLEMASSIDDAVKRLRAERGMRDSFEKAYGAGITGITAKRIGEALAAYLETVKAPDSPYRAYRAGNKQALNAAERRGLEIFEGAGQCSSCHAGEALSDGKMHMAFMPGSTRDRDQTARSAALARQARQRKKNLGLQFPETGISRQLFERLAPPVQQGCDATMSSRRRSSTYDGQDPEFRQIHTLSLWDVTRTGPWFRDGSASTLEDALQTHMGELRQVSTQWKKVRELRRAAKRRGLAKIAAGLEPEWLRVGQAPAPEDLTAGDIQALIAFLGTLSPRD